MQFEQNEKSSFYSKIEAFNSRKKRYRSLDLFLIFALIANSRFSTFLLTFFSKSNRYYRFCNKIKDSRLFSGFSTRNPQI